MPDVNGRFRGSGWSRAREDGWERAFGPRILEIGATADGGWYIEARGILKSVYVDEDGNRISE